MEKTIYKMTEEFIDKIINNERTQAREEFKKEILELLTEEYTNNLRKGALLKSKMYKADEKQKINFKDDEQFYDIACTQTAWIKKIINELD